MKVHTVSRVLPRNETTTENIEEVVESLIKSVPMLGKSLLKIEREVIYGYAIVSVVVRVYWTPVVNRRAIRDSLARVNRILMGTTI